MHSARWSMANGNDLRVRLRRAALIGGRRAAQSTVRSLKAAAPVDTGDTRERIAIESQRSTPTSVAFTIVSPTPQSNWTEFGTRPHVIRPRRRKALRFVVGGQTVFARKVNHPGNPPRPWFFPTVRREWRANLEAEVRRELR